MRCRSVVAELPREIVNLGEITGAAPVSPAPPTQPIAVSTVTSPVDAAAERRHVTEMLYDLVDWTGISAKLDAEEWRDLVGAYLDAASTAVTEMGDKVASSATD
jgi:class 3 adenylate cyclase